MLEVRVLGGLGAVVDGVPVALPADARARELLAWLALNPGLHSRSALAGRLRPDVAEESARKTLRDAVYELRRALGPAGREAVVATRDRVGLRDEEVRVNVREFRRRRAAGDMAQAVAAGDGELLAGLDEDWVLRARAEHLAGVGGRAGRARRARRGGRGRRGSGGLGAPPRRGRSPGRARQHGARAPAGGGGRPPGGARRGVGLLGAPAPRAGHPPVAGHARAGRRGARRRPRRRGRRRGRGRRGPSRAGAPRAHPRPGGPRAAARPAGVGVGGRRRRHAAHRAGDGRAGHRQDDARR